MGRIEKICDKIKAGGGDHNLPFDDLRAAALSLPVVERSGSKHAHIFQGEFKDGSSIFVMLQPDKNGKAKPYQIRQVRKLLLQQEQQQQEQEQNSKT